MIHTFRHGDAGQALVNNLVSSSAHKDGAEQGDVLPAQVEECCSDRDQEEATNPLFFFSPRRVAAPTWPPGTKCDQPAPRSQPKRTPRMPRHHEPPRRSAASVASSHNQPAAAKGRPFLPSLLEHLTRNPKFYGP